MHTYGVVDICFLTDLNGNIEKDFIRNKLRKAHNMVNALKIDPELILFICLTS